MSFLTPLYALGFLAIAAPIVFHLIRRTPRGEVPSARLMFSFPLAAPADAAEPSRPLALASASGNGPVPARPGISRGPFWRQAAQLSSGDCRAAARVAVVIDTSASMRRGGLWTRARALGRRSDRRLPAPPINWPSLRSTSRRRPLLSFAESANARSRAASSGRPGTPLPSSRPDRGRPIWARA